MVLIKLYSNILNPCLKMNSLKKTLSHSQKRLEIFHLQKEKKKKYLMTLNHCSSFINIPVKETVNDILDQIYVHKTLPQICSRLIFKRLLMKLATKVTFTFNNKFCKQIDGCTMYGSSSVTLWDIYIYIYIYIYIIPKNQLKLFRHSERSNYY